MTSFLKLLFTRNLKTYRTKKIAKENWLRGLCGSVLCKEDPPEDPPEVLMADNRTMAELLQAPTEGYEDAIVILEIAANNFELKHGLFNLVQNKQFFGHDKEDPHAHIHYFNKTTSKMRVPNVPSSLIKLMLFPFSLEGAAWILLEKEAPQSILTWDDLVTKFINHRCQSEYELFRPAISSEVSEVKDMVRALLLDKKNQSSAPASSSTPAPVKAVEPNCVTCGGAHSYQNFPATSRDVYRDNIQEYVSQAAAANYNQGNTSFRPQMVNQPSAYQTPAYQAPIPQTQSVTQTNFESYIKANDAVLRNMQSQGQGVQNQCQGLQTQIASLTDMLSKFVSSNTASSSGSGIFPSNTITNLKEDLKGITTRSGVAYQGPPIPTPSKVMKQGTEVTKDQVQTPSSQSTTPIQPPVIRSETQTPVFESVFAPVSVLMPNLKPYIPYPSRRDNERRCDQANEQIEKFYEIFKEMSFEISFTDALILMLKFASTLKALIGNKEKLSEMARTLMNKHCLVVILNKLPRKLGGPTGRALIDVQKGELTLRIRNKAITYNLDQTMRYLANYNQMTANKIDVICEMYSQEVLGFSDVTASGNPTTYDDPIVATTSPTLTPFGDSDFLLFEETDAFLGLEDDPNSSEFNLFYYDPEGDILLLEAILNTITVKSFVDEPLEVELKDLPPHLEYALLEEDNNFPVIIAKELGDEEKSALIKVLKSHKRGIAWKLSDIHEVEKLLDTGLIYPIFDSPWVSPIHCVPKKGGFTVVENEENELIPTRLFTGWRVCIDYRKLNKATRKYHFPLPFMDQMLKRLARNEFYCFLDEQGELPSSIRLDSRVFDKVAIKCTQDILRQSDFLDWLSEIPWVVSTFVVIEGEDIVAKFCIPSRWKELNKEMSSKILTC
nr:reverse transcriptase domain-containing protein [Tanacetum cinerariifolium]